MGFKANFKNHEKDIMDNLGDSVQVTINGSEKTINAVFDNQFDEYQGDTIVSANNPYIRCNDTDIDGIATGDDVTIDSVDYTVKSIEPDSTGTTALELAKS